MAITIGKCDAWSTVINASQAVSAPPAVSAPLSVQVVAGPIQNDTQSHQKVEAALADISVDFDIIITEGDRLTEEFNKFESWSTASDNEIELAMDKLEEWRRKFERLQDKRWAIQRKTLSFKLDDRKMKSATSYMNTLALELDLALGDIIHEDQIRCLFSINKTKTASVRLPTFEVNGKEDFSKFEKEMKN